MALFLQLLVAVGLVVGRVLWAQLYSQDPRVVDVVAGAMPLLALSVASDRCGGRLCGTLGWTGAMQCTS